ncbi:hypothetical protein GFH48_00010 [Streptomyces fagopyri]|uniref:Uncharacterized protein n=1 Tax=Streptomyces fagopyri TaxID=2662397 RepID=A0A5Q0L465_9ACTN|nr:DUF6000 family protein [Streptomyces fagopyri]QFZ71880.1 hypothetical protein GFH48_00010 [Streptomyces fagopyri]
MSFPEPTPDPGTDTLHRYVIATPSAETGRYLDLLHGNFRRLPAEERTRFLQALGLDSRSVTDAELEFMLQPNWRSRITAAWMIGLDRREQFREPIGELLLASELTYAGQGYCIALALLGTPADAALLSAYLDRYLRRPECRYDQEWALGALLHLDHALDTEHAAGFLKPEGLWDRWVNDRNQSPTKLGQYIDEMCALAHEYAQPRRSGPL